jgi:hypothetical protein
MRGAREGRKGIKERNGGRGGVRLEMKTGKWRE